MDINHDPNAKPPVIKQAYEPFFKGPLENNFLFDARKFAILALIDSGFVTDKQLSEALQDQLHRTSVFTLLVTACDEGLLCFKTMVNRERHFVLTQKAKNALAALVTLAPLMLTSNVILKPHDKSQDALLPPE